MIGCLPLMPCAAPTLDPCRCRMAWGVWVRLRPGSFPRFMLGIAAMGIGMKQCEILVKEVPLLLFKHHEKWCSNAAWDFVCVCVGFSSTWSWHILNITWCISIRRTWCIQSDVLAGSCWRWVGSATSGMTGRVVATSLRASTVKSPVVHLMKVGCCWLAAV